MVANLAFFQQRQAGLLVFRNDITDRELIDDRRARLASKVEKSHFITTLELLQASVEVVGLPGLFADDAKGHSAKIGEP